MRFALIFAATLLTGAVHANERKPAQQIVVPYSSRLSSRNAVNATKWKDVHLTPRRLERGRYGCVVSAIRECSRFERANLELSTKVPTFASLISNGYHRTFGRSGVVLRVHDSEVVGTTTQDTHFVMHVGRPLRTRANDYARLHPKRSPKALMQATVDDTLYTGHTELLIFPRPNTKTASRIEAVYIHSAADGKPLLEGIPSYGVKEELALRNAAIRFGATHQLPVIDFRKTD